MKVIAPLNVPRHVKAVAVAVAVLKVVLAVAATVVAAMAVGDTVVVEVGDAAVAWEVAAEIVTIAGSLAIWYVRWLRYIDHDGIESSVGL